MKNGEKKLFTSLCSYKEEKLNPSLLYYATPAVLGYLFMNRMQGVAFGVLKKNGTIDGVCREFGNSLKTAAKNNEEKNADFYKAVRYVSGIVRGCDVRAAFLKGAVLCGKYPKGFRTSNDIDILLSPSDVSFLGKELLKNGFMQGKIKNGEFIPAERREIISSKINRGETVPYVKEINQPKMKFLEVDLNFSLDCKADDGKALGKMLEKAENTTVCGVELPTLCKEDFFIYLCLHLYKEAANLPWIKMKRDMTLYKYCDIYSLLEEMTDCGIAEIFKRAEELGAEKETAFAIIQTTCLFNMKNRRFTEIAEKHLDDKTFCDRVFSPSEKKTYLYKKTSVSERFFSDDRLSLLTEEL